MAFFIYVYSENLSDAYSAITQYIVLNILESFSIYVKAAEVLSTVPIKTRPIASENRCKLYPPEENSPKPF